MNCPDHLLDSNAPILSWRDGACAHLRFNRPRTLNAIDLISGAGRAFIPWIVEQPSCISKGSK
jgi:hypothetical protein